MLSRIVIASAQINIVLLLYFCTCFYTLNKAEVASISHWGNICIPYLNIFDGKRTRSATKKLPKWVSETSEETRSYRLRLEWAELIVILIKIRGLPGPSRNAFASRRRLPVAVGRLPFASFPICITVKIPGITLYMPRDVLRAAVT